jgi:hypothetical protein
MSNGGISPSGRLLRLVLWRLPLNASRYALARNSAAATEHGRYILALAGFGFWVTVFWFAASWWHEATGMVVPLQLAGLLGLLLLWRIIGYLRRLWVNRRQLVGMAVNQQRQRQMFEMQAQVLRQVRQMAASVPRPDGGVDVLGMFKTTPDPITAEHRRMRAEQARQVRDMLPEGQRPPFGDRNEPLISVPRWLWKRRPR